MLIDEQAALKALEDAIWVAGGPAALARKIGVSKTVISCMREQSARRQPITGKVANYLNLKRVSAYQRTEPSKDPKQEQYEKERRIHAFKNGIPLEQSKTMRVAGEPVAAQRYPDKA